MKHHRDHAAHSKHHGHKEAHAAHMRDKHAKMEHQMKHGRGVHAVGPDYAMHQKVNSDNHQQGIARVMQKPQEMEVGHPGKMHWSEGHRDSFNRRGGSHVPKRG